MQGLLSILSLFCNKLNKFNNTGAQILDSIYMTSKLIKNHIFGVKVSTFYHLLRNVIMDIIVQRFKIFLHGVISLPDPT